MVFYNPMKPRVQYFHWSSTLTICLDDLSWDFLLQANDIIK